MSTAASLHGSYNDLLEEKILKPLNLDHTYLTVPASELSQYAEGYTVNNIPHRIPEKLLFSEAYGIKSCSADLIRYVQANLQELTLPSQLQNAILNTHNSYFKTKDFTQDLVWEQYAYPVTLNQLLKGNDPNYIFNAHSVKPLMTPIHSAMPVLINKTGSTDGFAAYIAFVPTEKIGIVVLANKAMTLQQRVKAAHQLLSQLMLLKQSA